MHPLGELVRRYPAAPGGLQAGSCAAEQRKEEGCRKRGDGESAREREAPRQTEKTERERGPWLVDAVGTDAGQVRGVEEKKRERAREPETGW